LLTKYFEVFGYETGSSVSREILRLHRDVLTQDRAKGFPTLYRNVRIDIAKAQGAQITLCGRGTIARRRDDADKLAP
jgi:hypothetical protein